MTTYFYLPLNAKATEAHRFSWEGQYFNAEPVFVFEKRLETKEDVAHYLTHATMAFKLVPFRSSLRAKMRLELGGDTLPEETHSIFLFTVEINLLQKSLTKVVDVLQATHRGNPDTFLFSPDNANKIELSVEELERFTSAFNTYIKGPLAPQVEEPFACFFPELLSSPQWKERLPTKRSKGELIPYQMLFPFAGAIERTVDHTLFALDDLYCTEKSCDCREVNNFVLKFEPGKGREETVSGFRYHFDKKTYKILPHFPAKVNVQELSKQFSLKHFVNLTLLFEERYKHLRSLVN